MGIQVDLNDDETKRLRNRAREHGRSLEEEARQILTDSLGPAPKPAEPGEPDNLYDQIRADVAKFGGGFDLKPLPRQRVRTPPGFDPNK